MKHPARILYTLFSLLLLAVVQASWAKTPEKPFVPTSSGAQSTQKVYEGLLEEHTQIGAKISELSLQLQGAPKSKAQKIDEQIKLFNGELLVVERKLAAFPVRSTGGGNPQSKQNSATDNSFLRQVDSIISMRVATSKPFAGQLSTDPELERVYRTYLHRQGDKSVPDAAPVTAVSATNDGQALVYRVIVAMSKTRLPASQFSGLSDLFEQAFPAGGYAYYAGQYSTLDQAQALCNQILARQKFRDAFVVAMQGTRHVPIRK